jgi:hypothetical protein
MAGGATGDDIKNFLFNTGFFENAWLGFFQYPAGWQMTAANSWLDITDIGDNA